MNVMEMNWYARKTKIRPIIVAASTLLIIILGIQEYTNYQNEVEESSLRGKIYEMLISKKSQLEKALYSRIYYTKSVAAFVSINSNITNKEFDRLAGEFKSKDSVISTMSIAKDCIISSLYPLAGHESAIGLNLLAHPGRREIVEKTIETHNTFVAGPVELVEGGIAFVSYTPIFTRDETGRDKNFWGVTDIVIYRDELFKESNLFEEDVNFYYALKGEDGKGKFGNTFWGKKEIFNKLPVQIEISLPTGSWQLACIPKIGWEKYTNTHYSYILYISAVIISLLIWLLTNAWMRIRENEREMKAIFASMEDLIIEYSKAGEYIKIAPTSESNLIKPKKDLLGKKVHDIFPKELADEMLSAIRKCISTKKLQIIEYPLLLNNNQTWFQARISYMSANSVIFLANDNTFKKEAELRLIESEQKLKLTNTQKDKFFSIIAHDLRNPLGSFKTLLESMTSDYDMYNELERKEYLGILQRTAVSLFALLENLLTWSRSQSGKLSFNLELVDIKYIVENCVSVNLQNAANKKIEISTEYGHSSECRIDINMILTVIRNLISNAVKFTKEGGKVSVSTNEDSDNIYISVKDNGVGMSFENIDKLFRIDTQVTSLGTNDEKGTGLGLILCKEFIEKHNGAISVKSDKNIGSTFTVSIPKKI